MTGRDIDVAFTWVDDRFPGYLEALNAHSSDKRDLNPNRTRDNLELLRFSLRSVAKHLPQVRRIYLFTCRPQVPAWLDLGHPKIKLVHHDEVMAPEHLPTFSSFGIVSYLHRLPGLSDRFLYLEDDNLLNSDHILTGLTAADGRVRVHLGKHWILPREKLNPETSSPWNLSLARMNEVLGDAYGARPRRQVIHGPQLFERQAFEAAEAAFPGLFEATRGAKFRSADGVPPENFVPHFAVETGMAELSPISGSRKIEGYASLENFAPWTWAQLMRLGARAPLSFALNDSFEDAPNPRVERMVRRWLEARYPTPAGWEQ